MSDTRHIVVIGAGMVGHRFVDELVRLDRDGRWSVTVIGAEEYEPYNRILLTELLAGRAALRGLSLGRLPERVDLRTGVAAVAIDREQRQVLLDDGDRLPYDRVVLATGARPFVPPIAGLQDRIPQHVHVVRNLDDTRAVGARAANARHAVVLGGGVLGLEAAAGLASRGVGVTVVQNEPQLMPGQLESAPAAILAAALDDRGVRVCLGVSVAEVIAAYDELVAVRLTDGTVMAADLMLVSCGVRPDIALASAAGLPVRRGVVVDADLTSPDDERVHAIGDCAEGPDGVTGLVAPGWAQAERLARRLCGVSPVEQRQDPHDSSRPDIRLKAGDLDLSALGVTASAADPGDRVLTVDDPVGRRHLTLVVRGDRLVGASVLGAPEAAAELSVMLDRQTPVPMDPLALLTPERRTSQSSPVRMPGSTTVCRCNNITKKQIVDAWEAGADTVEKVAGTTRATTGCGGCRDVVCGLVDWLNASDPAPLPGRTAAESTEQLLARP